MNHMITELSDNVNITDSQIIINGIKDKEILITGTHSVANNYYADTFRAIIIESNCNEISQTTEVIINKNSEKIVKLFYKDFDTHKICETFYRFAFTIILKENDILTLQFVNLKNSISKEKSKFALECTLSEIQKV